MPHQLIQSQLLENSGVCGVSGHPEAARLTFFGLYALQHRGQSSAGLVSGDDNQIWAHRGAGLAADVFTETKLDSLKGYSAIGHVWHAVADNAALDDIQPFSASHRGRNLSVALNGSIMNIEALKNELQESGAIFHSHIDAEVVVHLLARCEERDLGAALQFVCRKIQGAFSMLLLVNDTLVAVRDSQGRRPLCLGRLKNGGHAVVSETCALDLMEAAYQREIEPGEILLIDVNGARSVYFPAAEPQHCIMELACLARPDSSVFGIKVHECRRRMGAALAGECRIEADMVVPFPDAGTYAALGFAHASGIPFEMSIIRNHYIGRTSMLEARFRRDVTMRMMLNSISAVLQGKRVIIVEETTIDEAAVSAKVDSLRDAGAKEVHLMVICPPIQFSCTRSHHYQPPENQLADEESIERMCGRLGVDTLHYLSMEGLLSAAGQGAVSFCRSCIDG